MALAGTSSLLNAGTIVVDKNGSGDYTTIKAAIDSAVYGDIIQVSPGTYSETVRLKAGVSLKGAGADKTEILSPVSGVTLSGVVCGAPDSKIEGFTITGNNTWGISGYNRDTSSMIIRNNVITGHYVGIAYTEALIINNIIKNNTHSGVGLGNPTIKNNIITDNISSFAAGIYMNSHVNSCNGFAENGWSISYNNLWNNSRNYTGDARPGTGDIAVDPLFADYVNCDFHLTAQSPCVNAGDPSITDPDGTRSDMGLDFFPDTQEPEVPAKSRIDLSAVSIECRPSSPAAGDDIKITAYFKCGGSRDLFTDTNFNGVYDSSVDEWIGHSAAEEPFNITVLLNGKVLRDVPVTYPAAAGTGWRLHLGAGDRSLSDEIYRQCIPGENVLTLRLDSEDDIDELDEGNNVISKKIIITDNIAPSVSISAPPEDATVKNLLEVAASATDNTGIARVDFYFDNSEELYISDTELPYSFNYETHNLENGVHSVKAVAYDRFGNSSETRVSFTVENELPSAWIKVPKANKRIRGNAVTVMAETSDCVTGVLFQYRPAEFPTGWTNITSRDKKKPYGVYWNTSALENGEYYLRAVAFDGYGYRDPDPAYISVIIDDVNWDIIEDGNPDVNPNTTHRKVEKISNTETTEVSLADGTGAVIPPGINTGAAIEVLIPPEEKTRKTAPPAESSLKPAGVYREYNFTDGTNKFNKNITLIIPYPDENNDGIVDGTEIPAESLRVYWHDEERQTWLPVEENTVFTASSLESHSETAHVKVQVNHFTLFGLMALTASKDLDNVIVYPNPFKPNSGLGHTVINFDGLTEDAVVEIYTLSGKLLNELSVRVNPGKIEWDGRNSSGEKAASGVYYYLIKDGRNDPARGRLAIIR